MVCQNQSIDDSNAELAKDLRLLVRERIRNGDSDEAVLNYIVSRYGEFVLLKPRFSVRTVLLWGAPVLLILAGGVSLLVFARKRAGRRPEASLRRKSRRSSASFSKKSRPHAAAVTEHFKHYELFIDRTVRSKVRRPISSVID